MPHNLARQALKLTDSRRMEPPEMDFRVSLTVEVDQKANGLAIRKPISVGVGYHRGRWRFECQSPAVEVPDCRTLEEAVVSGARQVAIEVQASVIERPLIVGKITPDKIPLDMFAT